MTEGIDQVLPGHVLLTLLCAMLVVLAMRLADETEQEPRNHAIIVAGALFAFGLVYRITDVAANLGTPRWSAVASAAGMLAFLAADQRMASRYRSVWRKITGGTYTGPDRRRTPRLGTDPDQDHPRDEEA